MGVDNEEEQEEEEQFQRLALYTIGGHSFEDPLRMLSLIITASKRDATSNLCRLSGY